VGDRTEYAYGASVVDVTTNAGRTWWQAFLGEQVLAVTFQHNRLIAIVQQQTTNQGLKAVTQVYVSKDGGRHWRYNDQLGAL
jgi:phage baseplate assembly protein gpV